MTIDPIFRENPIKSENRRLKRQETKEMTSWTEKSKALFENFNPSLRSKDAVPYNHEIFTTKITSPIKKFSDKESQTDAKEIKTIDTQTSVATTESDSQTSEATTEPDSQTSETPRLLGKQASHHAIQTNVVSNRNADEDDEDDKPASLVRNRRDQIIKDNPSSELGSDTDLQSSSSTNPHIENEQGLQPTPDDYYKNVDKKEFAETQKTFSNFFKCPLKDISMPATCNDRFPTKVDMHVPQFNDLFNRFYPVEQTDQEELEKKYQDTTNQSSSLRGNIAELQEENDKRVRELEKTHLAATDELQKKLQTNAAELEKQHNEKVRQLEKKHLAATDELQKKLQNSLENQAILEKIASVSCAIFSCSVFLYSLLKK